MNRRAFLFTLDALLAIGIALAALAAAAALLGAGSGPAEGLALQRAAQESLGYLDNNRTLSRLFNQTASEGNATLAAVLPVLLPAGVDGRITVSLYEYDVEDDQFTLLRTVGASTGSAPSGGSRGVARRMFVGNVSEGVVLAPPVRGRTLWFAGSVSFHDVPGEQKDYFGLAAVETWFR